MVLGLGYVAPILGVGRVGQSQESGFLCRHHRSKVSGGRKLHEAEFCEVLFAAEVNKLR